MRVGSSFSRMVTLKLSAVPLDWYCSVVEVMMEVPRRVRVVGDGGAAVAVEPAPDRLSAASFTFPLLDGAGNGQFVLGDEGWLWVEVS
jgi:hypothetical protein